MRGVLYCWLQVRRGAARRALCRPSALSDFCSRSAQRGPRQRRWCRRAVALAQLSTVYMCKALQSACVRQTFHTTMHPMWSWMSSAEQLLQWWRLKCFLRFVKLDAESTLGEYNSPRKFAQWCCSRGAFSAFRYTVHIFSEAPVK